MRKTSKILTCGALLLGTLVACGPAGSGALRGGSHSDAFVVFYGGGPKAPDAPTTPSDDASESEGQLVTQLFPKAPPVADPDPSAPAPTDPNSAQPSSTPNPNTSPNSTTAPPLTDPDDGWKDSPDDTPAPAPSTAPSSPGSSAQTPSTPPAHELPFKGFWDGRATDGTKWTAFTVHALQVYGVDLLKITPADVQTFCPNFAALSRRGRANFWVKLISAVAANESAFDPKNDLVEVGLEADGSHTISRGLMQVSFGDAKRYGCQFATPNDVYDPRLNIECAVRILDIWIPHDGVITGFSNDPPYLGAGHYWSTLRPQTYKTSKVEVIRKLLRQTELCRKPN